jgi:hypothetical protein
MVNVTLAEVIAAPVLSLKASPPAIETLVIPVINCSAGVHAFHIPVLT